MNGHSVSLTNKATLVANPQANVGALSIAGGQLQLGTSTTNTGAASTLAVNGTASLDSTSTTTALINGNGSTPGTDFSQLSASGNVALNGTLKVVQGSGNGGCAVLSRGDVFTLVTTTGSLNGSTFANAPQGQMLTMASSCQSTAPQVQINYTSNSITATVMSGTTPTTTTLATPSASSASTNQKVTLTATVATNINGTIAPAGTVAFSANGTPISGCTSQPVTVSGSSGTATCTTSFAAGGSPESLTATFTGASGSGQATSASSAQSLTVNKGSTTTKLAASNTSPAAGDSVTYTVTVAPDVSGTTKPSGNVRFLDGGNPITVSASRRTAPRPSGSRSARPACACCRPSAAIA
ncbi:MAG TPA: Ig-like domain repeat protein [Solirubrobacteraceae bacterium]|nr:Ig-like domain repeat protein [Solirubrobacteraceae bacterium]